MAGHNKWSKIKRKKGVADQRRSKAWARLTRDLMVAAPVEAFGAVQAALAEAGIEPAEAGRQRIPTTAVAPDGRTAATVLRLLDALDDHPDVQAVYSTLDVDGETLASVADG